MKIKSSLFIVAFILTFSSAFSQNFGIELGYNRSNYSGGESSNALNGFNAGLIVDMMEKNKLFHINSGLKYSQKGVKTANVFNQDETFKSRSAYIEMPVNFALHIFGEDSKVGLMTQAGMYLGGNLKNDFAFDYGINFGVGVVGKVLKFGANYQVGLYEVYSNKSNRVFSVNLSLLFN